MTSSKRRALYQCLEVSTELDEFAKIGIKGLNDGLVPDIS